MKDFTVTANQKEVLRAVLSWLATGSQPFLTLGGYAGTGKSTLLVILRLILKTKKPGWRVAFAAYTGKASQVLVEKLAQSKARQAKDSVSTLHSLLYAPVLSGTEIVGWCKKDQLDFDLIIIDEASMVTAEIWRDVLSFGIPVLAVGDHGQLPPVEGRFNLMSSPELTLTKIHRQAADSPIIQVATLARLHGYIPVKNFGPGVIKFAATDNAAQEQIDSYFQSYQPDTLFLTGLNRTRVAINHSIRQQQWRQSDQPEPGDIVICLKNNWQKGLYNGLMGQITRLEKNKTADQTTLSATINNLAGAPLYRGEISLATFNQTERTTGRLSPQIALFDYGYALTVHKAQGSQAAKVVLIEERNRHMSDEDWSRWLYTAVTRAEKELYIFGS